MGAFLNGNALNIDDPYGQGIDGFRKAYGDISACLSRVKGELDGAVKSSKPILNTTDQAIGLGFGKARGITSKFEKRRSGI